MKIAFVVFEGLTTMDFLGVYDPVTRLKTMGFRDDIDWDICALVPKVTDTTGKLTIEATRIKPDLAEYDMFVVPGGMGGMVAQGDPEFIQWLQSGRNASYKMAVCNGSIVMGHAGYLQGKKATTNRNVFDQLPALGAEVVRNRVVEDGDVITAGGVSSSIDLGLYLVGKIAGREVMEKIKAQMEYNGFEQANIEGFGEPLKVA